MSFSGRKKRNKMRQVLLIAGTIILAAASSCSVQRYLPPGERLYKGSTVTVEKPAETTQSKKSLGKTLKLAVTPKPNNNHVVLIQDLSGFFPQ